MKNFILTTTLLVLASWPSITTAAPMDEFLTALPGHKPGHGEVEIGYDVMNSTVDILNIRKGSLDARGESIGNYSGGHIRADLALTKRLHADATLWKRGLKTPFDAGESIAWQGALQYQATVNLDWLPAIALRLSGWGDSADQVLKNSPTRLFDQQTDWFTARKMRVTDPKDLQFQGDIIGSWTLAENTLFSLFLSRGKSQVDFGGAFAEPAKFQGCEYEISGTGTGFQGSLVNATDNCPITSFSSSDIPIPDGLHIRYDSSYIQLGGSLQWFNEKWRSRIGYRFQKWDRGELDDAVRLYQHADKIVYDTNHHLTAEVGYKVLDKTGIFIRSQVTQHQFVGDVPFSYNLFSSHKFKGRYGFLTFGIVQGF